MAIDGKFIEQVWGVERMDLSSYLKWDSFETSIVICVESTYT